MPDLPRTHLLAWGVAAALALVAAARLFGPGSGPASTVRVDGAAPAAAAAGSHAPPTAKAPGGAQAPGGLWVHVAGAVARPGLYRVPEGSRVAAALDAAGGPARRAELAGVNLAAPLQDGQQVLVPLRGRGAAPPGAAPGSAPGGSVAPRGARLSLSTATVEQLDALDGIGQTLAQRIVEYRDSHGGFRSIDELREIEGIGEKRFEALREAVQP